MRMRTIFASSALLLGAIAFAQTAPLPPASVRFTVHQGDQPVGTASYEIRPENGGYRVTAHSNLHLQSLAYAFSKTEHLDSNLEIVSDSLNGTVNGSAVTVAVSPNNDKFNLDISANGQSYQNALDRHPQTVFFPDFDLSSYEVLLRQAAHSAGFQPWALIPKQTGLLMNAKLDKQPDLRGTLNGATTKVRHNTLTIGSVSSEVYSTTTGQVLEVDIPSQAFAIVRDQFQLQPPSNPGSAEPGSAGPGSAGPAQDSQQ